MSEFISISLHALLVVAAQLSTVEYQQSESINISGAVDLLTSALIAINNLTKLFVNIFFRSTISFESSSFFSGVRERLDATGRRNAVLKIITVGLFRARSESVHRFLSCLKIDIIFRRCNKDAHRSDIAGELRRHRDF